MGRRPSRALFGPRLRPADRARALLPRAAPAPRRRRPRGDDGGYALGIALAFAWLAYPFTLYTLGSSFNDSLVALGVVGCMLVLSSAPGRGAVAALSALTKFGTLALVPLFAAGTGERRPRTLLAFAAAFVAVAVVVTIPAAARRRAA